MTLTNFLLLSLLVGGAAFIQGAVGIGFAPIMAPVFGFFDASYLPVTLLVLMLPLNLLVAWRECQAIDRPGAGWITLGRFFGTFLGKAVLVALSVRQLEVAVGLLTILAALGVGLFTGVTETATGIGGPPLALLYQHAPGPVRRATVASCFLAGELISLIVLLVAGRVGAQQLLAALAPTVLLGSSLSRHVHARINGQALRLAVLIFSIVSGAAPVLKRQGFEAGQAGGVAGPAGGVAARSAAPVPGIKGRCPCRRAMQQVGIGAAGSRCPAAPVQKHLK